MVLGKKNWRVREVEDQYFGEGREHYFYEWYSTFWRRIIGILGGKINVLGEKDINFFFWVIFSVY